MAAKLAKIAEAGFDGVEWLMEENRLVIRPAIGCGIGLRVGWQGGMLSYITAAPRGGRPALPS